MSWRIWRWWLAGVIAYLIFLLATLPAAYAVGWLQRRVPQLEITGVSGSVWSGNARDIVFSGQSWGRMHWSFDWTGLFTGHPGYRLALQDSDVSLRGRVAGGSQNLLLRDIHGHLNVQRLSSWLPLPQGAVSGNLELQLARVTVVDDRPTSATGVINLVSTRLAWPQPVTLGNYQLKLVTRPDSRIDGTLLDTSGPLMLRGNLTLRPDGHYDVAGTLASRDASDTALNNLLRLLPTGPSGSHRFGFSGQW